MQNKIHLGGLKEGDYMDRGKSLPKLPMSVMWSNNYVVTSQIEFSDTMYNRPKKTRKITRKRKNRVRKRVSLDEVPNRAALWRRCTQCRQAGIRPSPNCGCILPVVFATQYVATISSWPSWTWKTFVEVIQKWGKVRYVFRPGVWKRSMGRGAKRGKWGNIWWVFWVPI